MTCLGQSVAQLPVPQIEQGDRVELRVAYVYNPRLEQMSPAQLEALLNETKRSTKQHFDIDLVFRDFDVITIDTAFSKLDAHIARDQMRNAYDFRQRPNPGKARLIETVVSCLSGLSDVEIEEMRSFAAPYLGENAPTKSLHDFANALMDTQLWRLQQWLRIPAIDGKPVINDLYNEWSMWVALGYADLPYDLILTNQLLASTEYYHCSPHTIIRGGISVGGTSYNRAGVHQAFVFLSTFPFTSNAGLIRSLRGNEAYTPAESAKFAGAYLTHEVGHLLFHFGHPFGQTQCVMNPSSLLRFREWYQATNKAHCPFESHAQMVPGAFQFLYQRYKPE